MNTVASPYDTLYNNLKNRFTVIDNGAEYNVGDYMLMKAGKTEAKSNLPTAFRHASQEHTAIAIVNYMNDRLTVKRAPIKDKTIKRFPLRTSMSAMLSAVAACALIVSCGLFALKGSSIIPTAEAPASQIQDVVPEELETAKQ